MFLVIVAFSVMIAGVLVLSNKKYRNLKKGKLFLSIHLIIIAFLIVLFIVSAGYTTIDKCLDNGGRWNSSLQECEYE